MWFDPGLAGLFITSTLLNLEKDINLLIVSSFKLLLEMIVKHPLKSFATLKSIKYLF